MSKHIAKMRPGQYNAEAWARDNLFLRDWREARTNEPGSDHKVYIFDPKDYAVDSDGYVDLDSFVPAADTFKDTGRHSQYVVRAFCTGCGYTWADWDDSDFNVWGTKKSDINADEFCVECEREVPYHYENCPLHRSNKGE